VSRWLLLPVFVMVMPRIAWREHDDGKLRQLATRR
jgi:hypothetical protein